MTAKASVFSFYFALSVLATALFTVPIARAAPLTDAIISEFVADNSDGIRDKDGDREDWIEIWNTSGVVGDLGGWYLTDDPLNLKKWELPAIEMTSGGYLVVFASGKDRADAAGEPHTNFRLQREADGYLALVKPDGVTIASEFVDYPEQFKNIAYGVGIEGETPVTFFSAGAAAKWHVPTGPVAAWTATDFDDSAWNAGATGIGYDSPGGDYEALLGAGGNARDEILSKNATVYIRIPFEVADPTGISNLSLRLKWEDGFVAHLNGTEFHQESAPENPVWDSEATSNRSSEEDAITFFDYAVNEGGLVAGTNVLSIQGLNASSGSSDLLFVPEFVGVFKDTKNLVEGYFVDPTPDAENGELVNGIVEDTKFSIDRGFYDAPIDVAITTNVPDAEIRYTTDGTLPSETVGTLYSGPVRISKTSVLRAIGYRLGFRSTGVDTHTYVFASDVYGPGLVDGLKAVPTISVVTQNASFLNPSAGNDYNEYKSSIEMIYPDDTPGFQEDAGLTNFGGRFTRFDKKSFRLYFRKEYGAGKLRHPIFDGHEYKNFQPAEEFDAINLRSGSHDMSNRGAYMGTRFADDSMLDMGQIAPHGRYVHLYLNGKYWGQYHLRERWNADMASSYFGGTKEDYDAISANNTGEQFEQGAPYDGTAAFWNETRTLINGPEPFVNAAENIDIANLIDFMLLWTSGECESEFRAFGSQSRGVPFKFMVRDPDGFLPGGGWGHVHAVTHNGPLNSMTRLRTEGNPDYKILLADRIHKHFFNDGALTGAESVERLRKRFEEMRPGFEAEARRWNYQSVASWEAYVNRWLNTGLPQRTTSMIQRLRQAGMYPDIIAPVFSQHGGSIPVGGGVTMATGATAIYYTLDGSDPRLPGGAISPGAILAPFEGDIPEPRDFIDTGDTWSYLDDGSNQGTAWRAVAFNDSAWPAGPSELGYAEGDEATLVGYIDVDPETPGTQRNATTYFRHTANISEPASFSYFSLKLKYDDAAAVYINGVEAIRTANLPAGAAFDTYATSGTPDESAFFEYIIPPSMFIDGENTIAVEIHNSSAGSSDISFDLRLRGEIDTSNGNNLTKPVILTEPALLSSRSYNSATSEWSAMTSAFFSIGSVPASAQNLVISEIHYHPAEPLEAAEIAVSADRDDYEFIELLNIGAQPIDLSGVNFSAGIKFNFPTNTILDTGARAVLVRNALAFVARYGAGIEIAGEYSGRLSNDGELLTLTLAGTGDLRSLTYNDKLPWPTLPDGDGFSLVLIAPTSNPDHALPSNWGTHVAIGGAPGQADAVQNVQLDGYAAWKAENKITDDNDDRDGDGLSALVEYALGTSPTESSLSSLPRPGMTTAGEERFLTITYEKNPLASDIVFQLESSTDLKTWRNENAIAISANTFRTATSLDSGGKYFLRLKVSHR